jgi:FKBP-type peptidyl-prolyl cis-trans isomerase
MRIGGTRRLRVAPHLGYGNDGVPGKVPPNALLTVEVHVVAESELQPT